MRDEMVDYIGKHGVDRFMQDVADALEESGHEEAAFEVSELGTFEDEEE